VLIDPSTVAATVKSPDGTTVTYTYAGATVTRGTITDPDSGITFYPAYYVDIAPTMKGTYRYRFFSTGTGTGAQENWFQVRTKTVP
jgi:hypothetical protein